MDIKRKKLYLKYFFSVTQIFFVLGLIYSLTIAIQRQEINSIMGGDSDTATTIFLILLISISITRFYVMQYYKYIGEAKPITPLHNLTQTLNKQTDAPARLNKSIFLFEIFSIILAVVFFILADKETVLGKYAAYGVVLVMLLFLFVAYWRHLLSKSYTRYKIAIIQSMSFFSWLFFIAAVFWCWVLLVGGGMAGFEPYREVVGVIVLIATLFLIGFVLQYLKVYFRNKWFP